MYNIYTIEETVQFLFLISLLPHFYMASVDNFLNVIPQKQIKNQMINPTLMLFN